MTNTDDLTSMVARELSNQVIYKLETYTQTALTYKKDRVLPYISKQRIMNELDISTSTLDNWEKRGLKRYKPRYQTSLVYYKIDDITKFIALDA